MFSDSEDSDSAAPISSLSINQKFAQDYEKRKNKQELNRRASDLNAESEEDESTSEEEDEDGMLLTPSIEKKFLEIIPMIRSKNEAIYKKDLEFFPKYEKVIEEASKRSDGTQKKEAPVFLRDLERQRILEKIEKGDDGEEISDHETMPRTRNSGLPKVKAKLDLGDDDDDDRDLFTLRTKSGDEAKKEEEEYEKWEASEKIQTKLKPLLNNSLEAFWSAETATDDNEKFLRDFIVNERWCEKDKARIPTYKEVVGQEGDSDVEDLEKQEAFEAKYNFRFEEEGGRQLQTFSRNIEDSLRQNDKRKKKREQRKEKKRLERVRKEEEIKRLKNLKKSEIARKIHEITKITGASDLPGLENLDLESDFDPEAFSKQMDQIFNDDFYSRDDDEEPISNVDDQVDDQVEEKDDDSDKSQKSKKKKQKATGSPTDDHKHQLAGIGDNVEDDISLVTNKTIKKLRSKRPKEENEATQSKIREYIDEYYNLDYEDMIGDLPCRFKYKEVKPNNFKLSLEEILYSEEKDLNKFVSIKRLAPYREAEFVPYAKKPKLGHNDEKVPIPVSSPAKTSQTRRSEGHPSKKNEKKRSKK